MPPVNWDVFEQLPGAAEYNFEMLCRSLMRRHYGQYGDFAALAAQPGVEFHLKIHTSCPLGDLGQWYGWQCRWYDLPSGKALGTTRRDKIAKAITTTEKELPDLTDWVLWTRRPLTKGDQKWFRSLKTHMRLHLWTAADIEDYLSGDAVILRSTYFGELVLTPDTLASLHEIAVAPIRRRWQPDIHQTIDAERVLRRMLMEVNRWDDLKTLTDQLELSASAIETDLSVLTGPLVDETVEAVKFIRSVAAVLINAYATLDRGNLELLPDLFPTRLDSSRSNLATLPRRLRANRKHVALTVTNALADAHRALSLLEEINGLLGVRLVAIVADAGCGKTELSAQLTASIDNRPAGVLLYGRDLQAGHTLDNLAHHVVIQGHPVSSMEALVAAVDAAGQRAHQRLPIVIDGLNEAEDPRDWKNPLASLCVLVREYPYVLVVCTLRSAFIGDALPSNINQLKIPDFGHDTVTAIRRYFAHYQINPADAELPIDLLRHPLTLRLFCEVTNPSRKREVGIEAMPGSLSALFERYLNQATERIAELAPRSRRYYEQDIRVALDEIGMALWEEKTRSIDLLALRKRLGDDGRLWNESMIRALEQDGVLLSIPGEAQGNKRVAAAYDALGGHLVADAILARHGRVGFSDWLSDSATAATLTVSSPDRHPLAEDIFSALVGLVPRRLHSQQLWPLLEEPLRTIALFKAAKLEGTYLDSATINQLAALAMRHPIGSSDLLDHLWHTRGAPGHPLNALFLDDLLRPMTIADRDLRWTEWIRRHWKDYLLTDLERLEKRWRESTQRAPSDCLRARWVMWMLTSTVRELRDQSTRTLYWFGRGDPAALFTLTLDGLAINDPYVTQRLLAACYGVVMAHQQPETNFINILRDFLTGLRDVLIGHSATHPTNDWLARLYVEGIVTLALTYYADGVPKGLTVNKRIPFAPGPSIDPIVSNDPRAPEINHTLNMDFENYTLGRLFRDRSNYDMEHPGHQAAVAHVRGTVWALGWREGQFDDIDNTLHSYISRSEGAKIERYGKKYGWIGFYTYAGMLDDAKRLRARNGRLSDVDIDPSFPESPPPTQSDLPNWAKPTPKDDSRWMRQGLVTVPNELLYRSSINSHPGPWIAVQAHLETREQTPGRRVFGILTALLVDAADAERLIAGLNGRDHPGNWWLPEVPSDYYTFAGEIPWSPEFARIDEGSDPSDLYSAAVKVDGNAPINVEILAHYYAWESYHCVLNQAGGALVPSRPFSKLFDLRGVAQSFDQILPDGSIAALSLGAPPRFDGHLLYLREDLVHQYAAGRRLIWFTWGERQPHPYPHPTPDWLVKARQNRADVWRHVCKGEELSRAFASDPLPRSHRIIRRAGRS